MNDTSGGDGTKRTLPQAGQGAQGAPEIRQVRSSKLLLTLGAAGALAGLLIVFVHQVTEPRITAYKAMKLREAVAEVLASPARWDTLYVMDDELVREPPTGAGAEALEMVFLGYDEAGIPVGYAIQGAEPGFQDVIELIFGYDAETNTVLGMKVLANKETPGLGDKIVKDSAFIREFQGVEAPLAGVKSARATGAANEVDMITGATISSRTVIDIINHQIERLDPLLDAYLREAS